MYSNLNWHQIYTSNAHKDFLFEWPPPHSLEFLTLQKLSSWPPMCAQTSLSGEHVHVDASGHNVCWMCAKTHLWYPTVITQRLSELDGWAQGVTKPILSQVSLTVSDNISPLVGILTYTQFCTRVRSVPSWERRKCCELSYFILHQ